MPKVLQIAILGCCRVAYGAVVEGRARRQILVPSPFGKYTNITVAQPYSNHKVSRRFGKPLVIGIHILGHDVSLAVVHAGHVVGVIELERMHKMRYFDFSWATKFFPQAALDLLGSAGSDRVAATLLKAGNLFIAPAVSQLCRLAHAHLRRLVSEPCTLEYDVAVFADPGASGLRVLFHALLSARDWYYVDHHHAHAASGWLDSPFYRHKHENPMLTLVLSFDGHGNDGTMRAFTASSGNSTLDPLGLPKIGHSFGFAYSAASFFVRDLGWGTPYGATPPCDWQLNPACQHAMPGSFMAFAAIGSFRKEWQGGAFLFLNRGRWDRTKWPSPYGGECDLVCVPNFGHAWFLKCAQYFACPGADENAARQLDRDFAATIQAVFEHIIIDEARTRLKLMHSPQPKGLVIVGGCAMNVKANSALARTLQIPVHVPPAPMDAGLSLGAAWLISPPSALEERQPLQFSGAYLSFGSGSPAIDVRRGPWPESPRGGVADIIDQGISPSRAIANAVGGLENNGVAPLTKHLMRNVARRLGGVLLQSITHLASLLAGGAIVGVARGRAELGPRALGHRSLLAAAHLPEQKKRLNRMKDRRWYRPCAPMILAEDLNKIFEPGPDLTFGTPYMSFAPPLQPWASKAYPGIAHIDGTARPQSVSKKDDPWMYSLLEATRAITWRWQSHNSSSRPRGRGRSGKTARGTSYTASTQAVGVLINTSLNHKGMPIVADALDVLLMFCAPAGDELDYVLIEDKWLFHRPVAILRGLCSAFGHRNVFGKNASRISREHRINDVEVRRMMGEGGRRPIRSSSADNLPSI